jgi:mannose-6-phosphate isomerase
MTVPGPLRLEPRVKDVVWGGQWLSRELGRPCEQDGPAGESWEAWSGSVIRDGAHRGKTLGELFIEHGPAYFGSAAAKYPRFPLLVKFIDAHENLSVQVHPDNEKAMRLENYPYGKTEFWYVLEAAEGAEIVYGLAPAGITRKQLRRALAEQDFLRFCRSVPVRKGDVVFLPAGTVHALAAGVVVYELQQDSDITYRLYDWDRTEREIHPEKGLEAVDLRRHSMQITRPVLKERGGCSRAVLAHCDLFHSELVQIARQARLRGCAESFLLLTVLEGGGTLLPEDGSGAALALKKGDTVFLPAGLDYGLRSGAPDVPLAVIESRLA